MTTENFVNNGSRIRTSVSQRTMNSFQTPPCKKKNGKKKTYLALYQTTNFVNSAKFKDIADDNCKFAENARQLLKRVENTSGKEEIARYEQFLLFQQCFQKTCSADTQKPGLVWERVN